MSINCPQLRDVIIKPVLTALGMNSLSAVNLLLGTAAQESQMGHYIVQQKIGFKGGIGIYQMQKPAFEMVWDRLIYSNPAMLARMRLLLNYNGKPPAERMASDIALATAMTRLYYYAINTALPEADDIVELAMYWKKFYNSPIGKGTEQQFVDNYHRYVLP